MWVKNAYDADATRVLVRFCMPSEADKGSIEIIDNGHGMSLETIQTVWMEPATLFRKRQDRSEKYGRRVLGEKGVGRFAFSRLGDFLEVVTRRTEMEYEVRAYFDWKQFDDENKYLEDIAVQWKKTPPTEICPDGAIVTLWREGENPSATALRHGTVLRMMGLRVSWNEDHIERLRTSLARLVSPFFMQEYLAKADQFQICLEFSEPFEQFSGVVEPPEALKNPHYTLKGDIDKDGRGHLKVKLPDPSDEASITLGPPFSEGYTPQCGPFHLELLVWDRDRDALAASTEKYGSTLQEFRQDLDRVAGINVYRDGSGRSPTGSAIMTGCVLMLGESRIPPCVSLTIRLLDMY